MENPFSIIERRLNRLETLILNLREENIDTVDLRKVKTLQEENKKLRTALLKIAQMSDPGSYEKAIVDMKRIAGDSLSEKGDK